MGGCIAWRTADDCDSVVAQTSWGDNLKKKKITDPNALMLQASLRQINKDSRDSSKMNAHMLGQSQAADRVAAAAAAAEKPRAAGAGGASRPGRQATAQVRGRR